MEEEGEKGEGGGKGGEIVSLQVLILMCMIIQPPCGVYLYLLIPLSLLNLSSSEDSAKLPPSRQSLSDPRTLCSDFFKTSNIASLLEDSSR